MPKQVDKHRPRSLDEVVGQDHVVKVLRRWIEMKDFPDFICTGPPGCGKTSAVLAFVSEFWGGYDIWNHKHPDFLELNASDDRGIDVIRGDVKDHASPEKPADNNVPFRIIFFDEADELTPDAQTALRRTVEKYADRCRFIYSGNTDNYIDAIKSRAAELKFYGLEDEVVKVNFVNIAKLEGVTFADDAVVNAIVHRYKGDMRKILNDCLEKIRGIDHPVTMNDLDFSDTMGSVVVGVLAALQGEGTPKERYAGAREFFTKEHARLRFDIRDFLEALHETLGPMSFESAEAFSTVDARLRAGGIKDIHIGYLLSVLAK